MLKSGSFGFIEEVSDTIVCKKQKSSNSWKVAVREIGILSKLKHPNIVKFLGYKIEKFGANIMLEKLDISLFDYIINGKTFLDRKNFITSICSAIYYLHLNGILHLDIKPDNIMVNKDGSAYLIDFGNSTFKSEDGIGGTYGYIPPEYYSQGTFSEKSDMFSLGVTVWEFDNREKAIIVLPSEEDNHLNLFAERTLEFALKHKDSQLLVANPNKRSSIFDLFENKNCPIIDNEFKFKQTVEIDIDLFNKLKENVPDQIFLLRKIMSIFSLTEDQYLLCLDVITGSRIVIDPQIKSIQTVLKEFEKIKMNIFFDTIDKYLENEKEIEIAKKIYSHEFFPEIYSDKILATVCKNISIGVFSNLENRIYKAVF